MDRRTAYTKKVIKNALYKLLQGNTLEHITVKEICQEAGINRATFYRHYDDLYDLFGSLERELLDVSTMDYHEPQNMERILKVISENQVFYKEFFRFHLESAFIKQVVETMHKDIAQQLKQMGSYDEKDYDVIFGYAFYGLVGVLWQWVEGGCMPAPEEFAPVLHRIVRRQFLSQA